jgi:hypothetical protein
VKFAVLTESYNFDVDKADSNKTDGADRIVAWFSSERTSYWILGVKILCLLTCMLSLENYSVCLPNVCGV